MKLEDFELPDTQAATAALEIARVHSCPALLNHVVRPWVWAEAFASLKGKLAHSNRVGVGLTRITAAGVLPTATRVGDSADRFVRLEHWESSVALAAHDVVPHMIDADVSNKEFRAGPAQVFVVNGAAVENDQW